MRQIVAQEIVPIYIQSFIKYYGTADVNNIIPLATIAFS